MNKDQTDADTAAVIAQAVAKTAADTAAAVAKTAADVASTAAISSSMATDISWIKKDIADIKVTIRDVTGDFVTKDMFLPVRNIVYFIVGALGIATLGAVFKLIFIR